MGKASNVQDVHTAGRLCDAEVEGCDAPRFQPLNINGWFWASTLRMMPPTNLRSNVFSITGDLANLTEPFALMASETKPAPLYCLGTVTTSGMTNLATPEDNLSAKICPFPTLILSGTRTLESTSLKLIHSCIGLYISILIYADAAKSNLI